MILTLALSLTLSASPELEKARLDCERDLAACEHRDALEAQERAAQVARARSDWSAQAAAKLATYNADQAAADQAASAADQALQRKCGKDYGRIRVGMSWDRARQCSGEEFFVKAEDERGIVYEAAGGLVRVERGRVTRWFAK